MVNRKFKVQTWFEPGLLLRIDSADIFLGPHSLHFYFIIKYYLKLQNFM